MNQSAEKLKNRGNRRGAVYVLSLITMLIGLTLALAMMRAAGSYFIGQDSRQKKLAAMNLAEAGADYAFWQVHYKDKTLPYSADVTLGTGSFHVDAVDDGNRDRSIMLITSVGTCGRHKYTMKRETLGLLPYNYAYCENRSVDDGDTLVSTGIAGGMRANGSIKLDSWSNNVTTGAWATSTITSNSTVTPKNPNSPPIYFPSIDYSYYNSVATNKYFTDISISWLNYAGGGATIYVQGRVWISGWYKGIYTIVATGDITVDGDLEAWDSSSYIALITQQHIRVTGSYDVEAVMYAHSAGNSATCELQGWPQISGVIASDDNRTNNTSYFDRDSRLNLSILRQLKLPGL